MKSIKLLFITALLFMMNSTYAVQYKFVAMDSSIDTKMCMLAGSNEIKALKKTLIRESRGLSSVKRSIANDLYCNDTHIAEFSKKYQANLTYEYLKKYTYKKNLSKETQVIIKDIAQQSDGDKLEEKIIIVYVGH